jgi:putative transposase
MCSILQVSRSRYYAWRKNPLSSLDKEDIILTKKIKDIFIEGRRLYGARKIKN